MRPERTLAVALHDIEPATFERAALIRDLLADLGVDRVTLLVIPAADMHPLSDRRPEVATWLLERAARLVPDGRGEPVELAAGISICPRDGVSQMTGTPGSSGVSQQTRSVA